MAEGLNDKTPTKFEKVTILSIMALQSCTIFGETKQTCVFGLGSDMKMYYWDYDDCDWRCYWQYAQVTLDKNNKPKLST